MRYYELCTSIIMIHWLSRLVHELGSDNQGANWMRLTPSASACVLARMRVCLRASQYVSDLKRGRNGAVEHQQQYPYVPATLRLRVRVQHIPKECWPR